MVHHPDAPQVRPYRIATTPAYVPPRVRHGRPDRSIARVTQSAIRARSWGERPSNSGTMVDVLGRPVDHVTRGDEEWQAAQVAAGMATAAADFSLASSAPLVIANSPRQKRPSHASSAIRPYRSPPPSSGCWRTPDGAEPAQSAICARLRIDTASNLPRSPSKSRGRAPAMSCSACKAGVSVGSAPRA